MTAKTLKARTWALGIAFAGLVPVLAGCGALDSHSTKRIPHYGVYDPDQPRELEMVSLPPYVVEPPDELEVSVRPASLEIVQTTLTVQLDGNLDLGFYGDVYVSGLTLEQIEQKIAEHVSAVAAARRMTLKEPVVASVRLVNGTLSKRYYVLGVVTNQGSFPMTGNETVMDGILTAGLRSNSLPEKAYLARPHPQGGPCQLLRIDWERIRMGYTDSNYQLMPGDRIYIPGGRAPSLISQLFGGG
jgi:polysaccharide export outer membrane protein